MNAISVHRQTRRTPFLNDLSNLQLKTLRIVVSISLSVRDIEFWNVDVEEATAANTRIRHGPKTDNGASHILSSCLRSRWSRRMATTVLYTEGEQLMKSLGNWRQ